MLHLAEHVHTLNAIWRNPHASRATLDEFRNRKLRRLAAHAHKNVTHYRQLFDSARIRTGDVQNVQHLERLPLTSKDDLRLRPLQEILSAGTDPATLVTHMTSGSSGKPFTVHRSRLEERLINLFRLRALGQAGRRVSDRIARIGEVPLGGHRRGRADRLRRALKIYRDYHIDCFQSAESIAAELEALNPDMINGYPSALGYVASRRELLARVHPRLVVTGGELLSAPVRGEIERAFGVSPIDFYGAHEFNLIAWECPAQGVYHVCDDNVIVELLREGKPAAEGETGEVVVTGLHTYTMPFIRYRTGDIATRGSDSCACGQPYSTLLEIQGRVVDYFRFAGNRRIHPYEITGPLIESESEWVFQHQIVQESEDAVRLKVAPRRQPGPHEMDRLQKLGRDKLGPQVRFTVELVDSFPLVAGRKFSPYPNADYDGSH